MDFNEHLADLAADGIDISAPVPIKPRRNKEPYFYDDEHEEPEEKYDDAD